MTTPHENRLQHAASPYLRSAAHQPVNWYEWGEEAFARARAEDKPILLDIGAVWCHWCHVMDRESYENPEIAELINRHFIPVKVDRDERPDVDARYQTTVSAISGQGGWPLTAFLTPEGMPFYGGTYFPPEDSMGRPGFKRILTVVAEAFRSRRADVDRSARALAEAVAQAESFAEARRRFEPELVDRLTESILRRFDFRYGGFGQAPKFPHPAAVDLLLERYQATREASLLTAAETTLEQMARGGIYDQLAGGFHRYSVDERWRVPHFEKMSYDNSELLKNYLHGLQVTGKPLFREVAEGILAWVDETLSDRTHGGFYASQDADYSLHDDGDYFTWTRTELRAVLSEEEAQVLERIYEVNDVGEMHHNPAKNVLWLACPPAEVARELGREESEIHLLVARARGKLLAARRQRPTPRVDTTLYTAWNAMFLSAYLEAARVLGREDCRAFALQTLERLVRDAWIETQGFVHRFGAAPLPGLLDDQVFSILALLDAYETTLDRRWFQLAERAMRLTIEKFGDAEAGGFFDRAQDAPPLGGLDVRRKPLQDAPTPSANSAAVVALCRLHALTGDPLFLEQARRTLEAFAGVVVEYGLFAASYGLAATLFMRHPLQVVITGPREDPQAARLELAAHSVYRFGKAVLRVTPEQLAAGALAPALQQTLSPLRADVSQALVCVETHCHPPVTEPERLVALLAEVASSRAAG
ncbi:MAG: thioredoxin domain-containing protein [Firmicutes bacterium]|nr:thioredoxin domain-containing protein [Bacillota bacterium]